MPQPAQLESRWPHRVAVLLVCAVFPLIWVGGLVTTYDAGMAVYDWPTTFGYNPFAYPISTWLAGPFDVFVEHGHRLLGALAGLVTIALLAVTCFCQQRTWLKLLAAGALVAVCFQGVLGGLRVLLDQRMLALVHGCVGPAFFALCAALAVCTSRAWHQAQPAEHAGRSRLHVLAFTTAFLAFIQLVLGAFLRHMPVTATPGEFRIAVLFHVGMALVVSLHVVLLATRVWRFHADSAPLVRNASILFGLTALQFGLGIATWMAKYAWPGSDYSGGAIVNNSMSQSLTITAHVATGSLMIAFSVVVALWSLRLVKRVPSEVRSTMPVAGVAA